MYCYVFTWMSCFFSHPKQNSVVALAIQQSLVMQVYRANKYIKFQTFIIVGLFLGGKNMEKLLKITGNISNNIGPM